MTLLLSLFFQSFELFEESAAWVPGLPPLYEGYVMPAVHHLVCKLALRDAKGLTNTA